MHLVQLKVFGLWLWGHSNSFCLPVMWTPSHSGFVTWVEEEEKTVIGPMNGTFANTLLSAKTHLNCNIFQAFTTKAGVCTSFRCIYELIGYIFWMLTALIWITLKTFTYSCQIIAVKYIIHVMWGNKSVKWKHLRKALKIYSTKVQSWSILSPSITEYITKQPKQN